MIIIMIVTATVHVHNNTPYQYIHTCKNLKQDVGMTNCKKVLRGRVESMRQSSATPQKRYVGMGLWKILHALNHTLQILYLQVLAFTLV